MARNCNCNGVCSCIITAGENAIVTGSGTATDPYVIAVDNFEISLEVADSPSLDLTLTGSGDADDPYILQGVTTVGLSGLSDVVAGGPSAAGDVPTWDGTKFVFAPPSVAPGQVTAGDGLLGDGSAVNPLRLQASGEFGTAPVTGDTQDSGSPLYIDSVGQVRSWVSWDEIKAIPDDRARKITISTDPPSGGADGDLWLEV